MKSRLPSPGAVGAPADPQHAVAAAEHVARSPATEFTPAYLHLARRGAALEEPVHA
ncbi:MAG: hypothetical protein JSR67_03820 [Proteobacteria bacterium]|nr:hypothetical protein [Pseudomonadota bacterium]